MGFYRLPKIIGKGNKPPFGARLNWHHPLSQGLVNAYLLNEGGGINIFDSVTKFGGTPSAAASNPAWRNNNLYFDGINDYIQVPNNQVGVQQYYSVVWAIKPNTAVGYNNTIYSSYGVGTPWSCWAFVCENGGAVYCGTINNDNARFTPTQLPAGTIEVNKINNLAFTNNNGTGYFYKNGASLGSKACANSIAWNGTFAFGRSDGYTIDGELLYIFMYNRTLSAIEIASLHTDPYQMFWHPLWDAYYVPAAAPPPTVGKSIFGYDSIFHAGGIIQT